MLVRYGSWINSRIHQFIIEVGQLSSRKSKATFPPIPVSSVGKIFKSEGR